MHTLNWLIVCGIIEAISFAVALLLSALVERQLVWILVSLTVAASCAVMERECSKKRYDAAAITLSTLALIVVIDVALVIVLLGPRTDLGVRSSSRTLTTLHGVVRLVELVVVVPTMLMVAGLISSHQTDPQTAPTAAGLLTTPSVLCHSRARDVPTPDIVNTFVSREFYALQQGFTSIAFMVVLVVLSNRSVCPSNIIGTYPAEDLQCKAQCEKQDRSTCSGYFTLTVQEVYLCLLYLIFVATGLHLDWKLVAKAKYRESVSNHRLAHLPMWALGFLVSPAMLPLALVTAARYMFGRLCPRAHMGGDAGMFGSLIVLWFFVIATLLLNALLAFAGVGLFGNLIMIPHSFSFEHFFKDPPCRCIVDAFVLDRLQAVLPAIYLLVKVAPSIISVVMHRLKATIIVSQHLLMNFAESDVSYAHKAFDLSTPSNITFQGSNNASTAPHGDESHHMVAMSGHVPHREDMGAMGGRAQAVPRTAAEAAPAATEPGLDESLVGELGGAWVENSGSSQSHPQSLAITTQSGNKSSMSTPSPVLSPLALPAPLETLGEESPEEDDDEDDEDEDEDEDAEVALVSDTVSPLVSADSPAPSEEDSDGRGSSVMFPPIQQ